MASSKGMLFDATLCEGCGACVEACQQANGQEEHSAERFDAQTFTYLTEPANELYMRRMCMHCKEPSCVSACPVGALKKHAQGPVTYDERICMGCRYCLMACPFDVPSYEWASATPRVRKCQMCIGRGEQGPACVQECDNEATIWGDRDALLALAKERLGKAPEKYDSHVYGATEAGGTDVLIIGPKSPAMMGLPSVQSYAYPQLTRKALQHVPHVVTVGAAVLGGLYWFTQRRNEVQRTEGAKVAADHA